MNTILHITTIQAWTKTRSKEQYEADSLQSEGFIHCSTVEQVLKPANDLFRGQNNLVLLCIAEERVQAPVIYEDCYESGQEFPHIYGPLNTDAVLNVVNFPPNDDGSFSLPPGLNLP